MTIINIIKSSTPAQAPTPQQLQATTIILRTHIYSRPDDTGHKVDKKEGGEDFEEEKPQLLTTTGTYKTLQQLQL